MSEPRQDDITERLGAQRGQIIILFAMFSFVLIGMLGLAMDLGFAFSQKRTIQNAADAGALAGARIVALPLTDLRSIAGVQGEVNEFAGIGDANTKNKMTSADQTIKECDYVDDDGVLIEFICAEPVPATAKGVMVEVTETHDTFFIQVIPGARDTVTTTASAVANVRNFAGSMGNAPIIVCGSHSAAVVSQEIDGIPGISIDADIPIWKDGNINPDAVGVTYRIHDEQLWKMPATGNSAARTAADCGQKDDKGADFKGVNEQGFNAGKKPGDYFKIGNGNQVGQVQTAIEGTQGCKSGSAPSNCVAILPIATNETGGTKDQVKVVGWAAFLITKVGNSHNGKLLSNYILSTASTDDWTRDDTSPVVIRLIR